MKNSTKMNRSTLRSIVSALFQSLTRLTVIGLENVPATGGVIIAVNHLSRLDPPLVFALIDRENLSALVAEKYKQHPLISRVVRIVDGIYINRGEADLTRYARRGSTCERAVCWASPRRARAAIPGG